MGKYSAVEPIPTGVQFFTVPCPWCRGTGRHPQHGEGWYVDYHFQDGHEQSGPHSREEAVRRVAEVRDPTCSLTLIGPDGCVYRLPTWPEENPER